MFAILSSIPRPSAPAVPLALTFSPERPQIS